MPKNRTNKLDRQRAALDRADREAHDALTQAEDTLFELEDRHGRRSARRSTGNLASRYPALRGS